jgi:DNA-binding MurR/RpiR family transcriptional regulator
MVEAASPDSRAIDARILDVFDTLTKGERRLAEVVLEAQGELHAFTAGELATRARVSKATAARFFQHLGYKSYSDVQRQARRAEAWGSPLYELFGGHSGGPDDFSQHLAQDIQNLTRTAALLRPQLLAQATKILVEAPTIWVVGFRNSYVLASYARALLVHVKPDIRLLPIAGVTLAEDFVGLQPEDALFVMGFRRRPLVLRTLMERARDVGARSILVTDLTSARTAQLATVTLRCHSRSHSLFDSYAAPISLINHICAATGLMIGDTAVTRLAEIERMHSLVDQASAPSRSRTKHKKDGK